MLACGAIRHSQNSWASNVVLVRKKDGNLRLCLDVKHLNSLTIRDAYMLLLIWSILDSLAGPKWFTSLNIQSCYWQVEIEETDKTKTALKLETLGFMNVIARHLVLRIPLLYSKGSWNTLLLT